MNGPDDTRDFDRVSRAMRAGDLELPPARVDQAVLQQAANAMRNGQAKYRVWHRWLVSGALAATLVLSVSLTIQLMVPQTAIMKTVVERQDQALADTPGRLSADLTNAPAVSATETPEEKPGSSGAASNPFARAPAATADRQSGQESAGLATVEAEEVDADLTAPMMKGTRNRDTALEAGMSIEHYALVAKTDPHELRELVEAQREQDRQEFLETYLDSDEYRQAVYGDPDRWLAGIADLIDMGQIALAKTELKEFVVAYPDYQLGEQFQL